MIDDGMRQGLVDRFPSVVPVTILAARTPFYERVATQRSGLTIVPLASAARQMPEISDGNVIVDGLDELTDPAAVLRSLRSATSSSRMFALISNGAFGTDLLNFLAGDGLAAAHPLVEADLDPLFTNSGWRLVDRIPLIDGSVTYGAVPYAVSNRGIGLMVATAEIAQRLTTAGFFVVADPQ